MTIHPLTMTGTSSMKHPCHSLVDMFRHRAAQDPDRLAYFFLADGETPRETLTYGELDQKSRAIAATLQASMEPGSRALLLYPPGLDFIAAFLGCLYAGVIAVPAFPPHPGRLDRALPRLRAIAENARVAALLGAHTIIETAPQWLRELPALQGARLVDTEAIHHHAASAWREPAIGSETIALLQYTSGSTATPKGVMVSHGNLLHNLHDIRQVEENHPGSCSVSWLPAQHDMGLIEGVLEPAFGGYPAYLMAPATFLQRPLRWLQAISRYRATISGGPNFAYDLCLQKITPAQRQGLDLSCWTIAYNGSEPVRHETITNFISTFADCGFRPTACRPVYGLAEATLLVSIARPSPHPVATARTTHSFADDRAVEAPPAGTRPTFVGCGAPAHGTRVVIAHPDELTARQPGEVGEIWIAGPGVAQGYWRQPDETAHTFTAHLAETGEGPFLRTGDLGFLQNGDLFITGRIKDLIIIRGRKLYPQDIERTMEQCHPAIRPGCCAAFPVATPGGEQLVVAAEVDHDQARHSIQPESDVNPQVMIGDLRQAIAELHEAQVHAVLLLQRGGIPRTSSGKLQRHVCRAGFLDGTLPVLAQWVQTPGSFSVPPGIARMGS